MQEEYFTLNLYGDNWGDFAQKGKYIFQNKDNIIQPHNSLPFLVFHFVTNYNLDDLELFFRLAGFSAFTEEELPRSIVNPISINLSNQKNVHSGMFGGITSEEEGIKHIESTFGEGIIARFRDIKTKQLFHKKVQLLEQIKLIEQDLNNIPQAPETFKHHL